VRIALDSFVDRFMILHDLANQTGNAEDKAMLCPTIGEILRESDQKEEALVWFEKTSTFRWSSMT
jgi:hypothetical protein